MPKYLAKITPYNCDIRVGPNNLGLIFSKLRQCQKIPPTEVVCLGKLARPSESDHFDPVPLKQNPNSSEAQSVLTKVSPADLSGQKCAQLTWRMSHTQMFWVSLLYQGNLSFLSNFSLLLIFFHVAASCEWCLLNWIQIRIKEVEGYLNIIQALFCLDI